MGKLSILIVVLFLAVLALFAMENQEVMSIKIPFNYEYDIPKIAFMLILIVTGVFITLLFFTVRDTKRFIDNWQYQKKKKRDIRVQDLYSTALNALLAHNENEAKEALEGILKEEPSHINALLRLGDISAAETDYQKANTYYQKAKNINAKNLEALFALAHLMEKSERGAEALKYIEEILTLDDSNLTALYMKRNILEKIGRWDDLVYLQKSIVKHEHNEKEKNRENKNLVGYKYEYGRYSLENNELEKAKKAFKTVLRMDKDFIPATLGIAEVMVQEGESEEAINLLEKTYEDTSSKIVLSRLEDLLLSLSEPARLIRIYKNSITKDPNDQVIKFFLGKLFYRLEMVDDAFDTLTTMDTGGTIYPELHQLLGNLYMRRNQPVNAVNEFKKVVELKSSLQLPYCCYNCDYTSEGWSGRCPNCKQWGTYQFNLDGMCKPY